MVQRYGFRTGIRHRGNIHFLEQKFAVAEQGWNTGPTKGRKRAKYFTLDSLGGSGVLAKTHHTRQKHSVRKFIDYFLSFDKGKETSK